MRVPVLILAVGGVSLLFSGQPKDCEAAGYCVPGDTCWSTANCLGTCVCIRIDQQSGVCTSIDARVTGSAAGGL